MIKIVYLIGAGAGDVGLLTIKAREILEIADVVIYDRLADEKILNYSPNAKKIYVGKSAGQHTLTQDEINKLLVEEGKQNKIVVRLKGGDPFVFGRGGEEALYLRENNLDYEIISGVTSAIAVPAYAGIPVTHRGVATSFAVVTGHEDPTKPESTINWKKLSTGVDTLIFLMGIANLPKITEKLIENGRDKNTPAAVIRNGTKFSQEVLITTLENAAADVAAKNIKPPAIFIVGDVVNLRGKLNWFDNKILFGKKILNTRARSQASKLTKKLENLGAEVIEFPTIKITEPTDNFKTLDAEIKNLRDYDWIIFTSTNGVEKFFERLKFFKLDARAIGNAKVATIGSATAECLENFGIIADLVPKEFRAESLIDSFKKVFAVLYTLFPKILIVRAEVARDILPAELKKFGAKVTVAPAYKTVSAVENVDAIKNLLNDGKIDFVTFTSSSTVENFVNALGAEILKKTKTAAIGPITAQTLKDFEIDADIVAEKFTIDGLVDAIKNF
ncbi:MAG: uroporphyrinogen-III C-methyltransferase [Selenomonadaceae bacterium]|nr:uroporphyrinogen-III C-methyltransferase [Selenomonadaceae bacterium]